MKNLRIILWLMVAVFAAGSVFLWLSQKQGLQINGQTQSSIGGSFNLIDHKGSEITEKDLAGRNHAIFFGFTHCPDICPTTLFEAAGWLKTLGADGDRIKFYFFTVDPERDTPEILKNYIEVFDKRITGVTGDPEEVSKALKNYKIYAKRVDLEDDDYTMDHTAFVMLFNTNGGFEGTISFGEESETAIAKLRRLINDG